VHSPLAALGASCAAVWRSARARYLLNYFAGVSLLVGLLFAFPEYRRFLTGGSSEFGFWQPVHFHIALQPTTEGTLKKSALRLAGNVVYCALVYALLVATSSKWVLGVAVFVVSGVTGWLQPQANSTYKWSLTWDYAHISGCLIFLEAVGEFPDDVGALVGARLTSACIGQGVACVLSIALPNWGYEQAQRTLGDALLKLGDAEATVVDAYWANDDEAETAEAFWTAQESMKAATAQAAPGTAPRAPHASHGVEGQRASGQRAGGPCANRLGANGEFANRQSTSEPAGPGRPCESPADVVIEVVPTSCECSAECGSTVTEGVVGGLASAARGIGARWARHCLLHRGVASLSEARTLLAAARASLDSAEAFGSFRCLGWCGLGAQQVPRRACAHAADEGVDYRGFFEDTSLRRVCALASASLDVAELRAELCAAALAHPAEGAAPHFTSVPPAISPLAAAGALPEAANARPECSFEQSELGAQVRREARSISSTLYTIAGWLRPADGMYSSVGRCAPWRSPSNLAAPKPLLEHVQAELSTLSAALREQTLHWCADAHAPETTSTAESSKVAVPPGSEPPALTRMHYPGLAAALRFYGLLAVDEAAAHYSIRLLLYVAGLAADGHEHAALNAIAATALSM